MTPERLAEIRGILARRRKWVIYGMTNSADYQMMAEELTRALGEEMAYSRQLEEALAKYETPTFDDSRADDDDNED
jgi:hypothetical protein